MLRIACLIGLLSLPTLAHGGSYKAPGSGAPADSGGGVSSGPGGALPTGGGPAPAAGAAATAGGSATSGTRGGSSRGGRSNPTGSDGSTGATLTVDGWEFWWQANRDRFVRLRPEGRQGRHAPGSPGLLTGRGSATHDARVVRPAREWVEQTALPSLLQLSTSVDDRNILDSALIAMSRAAAPEQREPVAEAARLLLAHRELSVQGAAALALGICEHRESQVLLASLLDDDSHGRQAVGGGVVPDLVRAFAALSLGLLGEPAATRSLLKAVHVLPDADRDIKSCAVAALGLLPPSSSQARTASSALIELLEDDALDAAIRAVVPTTLGKLGDRRCLPTLVSLLGDADTPDPVRQSSAIAVGALASLADESVRLALQRSLERERDVATRCFAWIALAQLGARDTGLDAGEAAHRQLTARLKEAVGANDRHRSWAALAAALYGRAHADRAAELLAPLRAAFADEHDPSFRGAFALALALLDDRASGDPILESLAESRQDDYRGHAAEALGLLRHGDAAPLLRNLCRDPALPETVRLKAATGLGLLADGDAVPLLLDGLESAHSLAGLSSMATALGLIGDARVGEPLIAMAHDDDRRELPRAFATVALGLLGERDEMPFNASLREQINYLYQTPTMVEVLRIN